MSSAENITLIVQIKLTLLSFPTIDNFLYAQKTSFNAPLQNNNAPPPPPPFNAPFTDVELVPKHSRVQDIFIFLPSKC